MDSKEHDIEHYMARGRQLRSEAIRHWFRAGITLIKRAFGRGSRGAAPTGLGQST